MNINTIRKNILRLLLPVIIITLILPMDVMAQRKGAGLIVRTKDHMEVNGRLIRVDLEEQALVVQTRSGTGMKVYAKDIDSITLTKGKFRLKPIGKGALYGFGVGAATAAILYSDPDGEALLPRWGAMIAMGIFTALLGAAIGTVDAVTSSTIKKKYYLKYRTPKQIKKLLKKLRKKARIR